MSHTKLIFLPMLTLSLGLLALPTRGADASASNSKGNEKSTTMQSFDDTTLPSHIKGTIASYDAKSGALTINDGQSTQTLYVDQYTVVTKEGKAVTQKDLVPGRAVTASTWTHDGRRICMTVSMWNQMSGHMNSNMMSMREGGSRHPSSKANGS